MAKNTIPTRMSPEFNLFAEKIAAQRVLNNVEKKRIPPSEVARMITNVSDCRDAFIKELTTKPRKGGII